MNIWQTLTLVFLFITLFVQDVVSKATKKAPAPAKKAKAVREAV